MASTLPQPTPTLVVYHAHCPDGFGAAWLYWRRLKQAAVYLPASYDDPPPEVAGHDVVVVDFSFPRAVVNDLARRARSFRLLDHHASAQEELGDLPCVCFDQHLSGVGLAWRDLHGNAPMPLLARCIQDRDLHQANVPDSASVLHVLDTLPYRFEDWQALSDLLDASPCKVIEQGRHMESHFQAMVDRLCRLARPFQMGSHRGLAVNAPMEFAAAVGHQLAATADFGFTWYLDAAGRVQASWRSRTIDVIALARQFGGGGHCQAAGARMTLEQLSTALGI